MTLQDRQDCSMNQHILPCGLQNSDGIFPNAAIAKKLGEVMGDSSKDISKPPSK